MIKMTGYQYKQFDKLPWNDDWWIEECEFSVNGVMEEEGYFPNINYINDNDIISITGGNIVYNDDAKIKPKHKTYEKYAKSWLKSQNTTLFVVECDNDKFDEIKLLLKAAGAKVIK